MTTRFSHRTVSTIFAASIARSHRQRRGNVFALMALILPVLALLAAFCINSAQMQLNRTELMVATDAAARAGGRAFSEHQTVEAAKMAAVATAALNNVDGQPLQIRSEDSANEIEFGITTQPNGLTGRYEFQKLPTAAVQSGALIASAVRVNGRRDTGSLSGRVPFVIPGILNASDFGPRQESVAMQVDRDISLILDRSGSMVPNLNFDWPEGMDPNSDLAKEAAVAAGVMTKTVTTKGNKNGKGNGKVKTTTSYDYAAGYNQMTYYQWVWQDLFNLPDCPMQPWQELVIAVDAFLNVLDTTVQEEQVSVASYASDASLDVWLVKNFSEIRTTVDAINPGGNTAIGDGMQAGIQALLDSAARPYAAKTMVVMTDGNHNRGTDPLTVANYFASNYPLTIHTVTFGSGANQKRMQQVAAAGGGKHYHADNGEQLVAIFEEIANNLPTILTK
ncbi:vWA domain-containing protein [Novipirellula caenicola]|uniref:VWFA domain-containing protein n=1 Tax=Novipirellula caenicola TaxID=1536901 RepID=A0ABP9VU00_9BACT